MSPGPPSPGSMLPGPQIHPQIDPVSHTWSYLVVDPATREAAIIDPVLGYDAASGRTSVAHAAQLLASARNVGANVRWLLETHAHADHLSAGHWLKGQLPEATLAIGKGIQSVQETFRPIFNLGVHFPIDGSQFDRLFDDGDRFMIGDLVATAIAVPGHTADSVAYLIGDALFVGDSLFMPDGGSARCDFPGGSARMLYQSIQRMFALPDTTRVFVCHDYGPGGRELACETTLAAQKAGNIHVGNGTSEDAFVAMREARDATLAMPALILPAIQANIRAGALPDAEDNGTRYLKIPLDRL